LYVNRATKAMFPNLHRCCCSHGRWKFTGVSDFPRKSNRSRNSTSSLNHNPYRPNRCYDSTGGVIGMEYLAAETAIDQYLPTLNHRVHELSPARRVFLTHHMLLRILQRRAKSMPLITLRYNCRVLNIVQFAKKVTAQTSFGSIIAQYCIGCDGSHGITRKSVNGGNMVGIGLLTRSLTIAFRVSSLHFCLI